MAIQHSYGSRMLMLVAYDVNTETVFGRRRLRRIANLCKDYGQRVQYSVFECEVTPAQWVELKSNLLKEYCERTDSLRFYNLGKNWKRRVEHYGVRKSVNYEKAFIL